MHIPVTYKIKAFHILFYQDENNYSLATTVAPNKLLYTLLNSISIFYNTERYTSTTCKQVLFNAYLSKDLSTLPELGNVPVSVFWDKRLTFIVIVSHYSDSIHSISDQCPILVTLYSLSDNCASPSTEEYKLCQSCDTISFTCGLLLV